tara:strand:- start:39612 stop:40205 length:594 start_codon:yes stop_codon:yes gene_type:complete
MVKLGVFYCCDKELESEVKAMKSFFKSRCTKHSYIDHPVHTSLYVFYVESSHFETVVSKFLGLKKSLSFTSSFIKGWKIFENDIMTGLNTLCFEFDLTNQIKLIQMEVVNSLHKYHKPFDTNSYGGELLVSQKNYGYPFIGDHWIPHITVGSLDLKPEIIKNLYHNKFKFPRQIKINNLNLYRIDGDHHELIEKIEF